jgi:hypothetical protein
VVDGGHAPGRLVCVVPASGASGASGASAVEVVTAVDGEVTARERVEATGERRPVTRDGCSGWESAEWSADARRVYLRSEHECAGGLRQRSSGVFAISPAGEWLDVQGVSAGGHAGVRVLRHRQAAVPASLPAELRTALAGRGFATGAARTAAAAPIDAREVVEASRQVDAPVVEAWLAERGQGFAIDGRGLVALADAGVPERVIDMMVALSYPKVFAVNPATRQGELRPAADSGRAADRFAGDPRIGPTVFVDPYGYGYSPFGWSRYSPFGYSPYGYGFGWYPGTGPVIVIRDPDGGGVEPASRGRAVKGRGYTREERGGSTGADAAPRGSVRDGPSRSGSGSNGRASSGSTGSGSTRTAKPRPR